MDAFWAKRQAKKYTNEQLLKLNNNNLPTKTISFDGGICSIPNDVVNGQVSACVIKGQTWTNKAGVGDTSPQTVENLDAAKTYLLINSAGANVEIDTVDTPTPVKLTGETSFDFVWASGKIALYELSAEEAALDVAVLGQKYHYVNGTKSTLPAGGRLVSVGKNLISGTVFADKVVEMVGDSSCAYKTVVDGRSCLALKGNSRILNKKFFDRFLPNTQYTIRGFRKRNEETAGALFQYLYSDGSTDSAIGTGTTTWTEAIQTSAAGKTVVGLVASYVYNMTTYFDIDTLQLEVGSTVTLREPYKESIVYINTNGEPLRSLPNGVKDEVNVTTGVKTQRVSNNLILNGDSGWANAAVVGNVNTYRFIIRDWVTANNAVKGDINSVIAINKGRILNVFGAEVSDDEGLWVPSDYNHLYFYALRTYVDVMAGADTLAKFKAYLNQYPITLIYQLATPIVTKLPAQAPLQVYENGTVYVEPLGDPAETTLPTVELTVPIGAPNKFGSASHDYEGAAADWVLNDSEQKCLILVATNSGGNANIILPKISGLVYLVDNKTDYNIVCKSVGDAAGTTILSGNSSLIYNI